MQPGESHTDAKGCLELLVSDTEGHSLSVGISRAGSENGLLWDVKPKHKLKDAKTLI